VRRWPKPGTAFTHLEVLEELDEILFLLGNGCDKAAEDKLRDLINHQRKTHK
jgi:hypothetical protein